LTGSVGNGATATANTTSIGAITGVAIASTTGARGNAVANSTAANATTGATDTVLASATSTTNTATVTTQTQANIGGSWFGNPGTASNGYAAYGSAMGSPTASVQSSYLASSTVNPIVYNSLRSSGSSIFGAGVLGANYSTTSAGSYTYTATNTQDYNASGTNSYTLGLLTMGAYNSGFTSLTFTVTEGATTLLTKTFTSLSSAQTYFTDDPVALGNLTGATDLTLNYKLTASTPEGAGISYLVADGPVSDDAKPATGVNVARLAANPRDTHTPESKYSSWLSRVLRKFDSAAAGAENGAPKSLLRSPEQLRAVQLLKGQHR
jgi:hypothetical protein